MSFKINKKKIKAVGGYGRNCASTSFFQFPDNEKEYNRRFELATLNRYYRDERDLFKRGVDNNYTITDIPNRYQNNEMRHYETRVAHDEFSQMYHTPKYHTTAIQGLPLLRANYRIIEREDEMDIDKVYQTENRKKHYFGHHDRGEMFRQLNMYYDDFDMKFARKKVFKQNPAFINRNPMDFPYETSPDDISNDTKHQLFGKNNKRHIKKSGGSDPDNISKVTQSSTFFPKVKKRKEILYKQPRMRLEFEPATFKLNYTTIRDTNEAIHQKYNQKPKNIRHPILPGRQ